MAGKVLDVAPKFQILGSGFVVGVCDAIPLDIKYTFLGLP
jgi:hypothetical protein